MNKLYGYTALLITGSLGLIILYVLSQYLVSDRDFPLTDTIIPVFILLGVPVGIKKGWDIATNKSPKIAPASQIKKLCFYGGGVLILLAAIGVVGTISMLLYMSATGTADAILGVVYRYALLIFVAGIFLVELNKEVIDKEET